MHLEAPRGYDYVLFLSFDFDADSAERYARADPVALSRGVFGARHGVPRVLEVLENHGVKATFFTPGWVAETYPEAVELIHGHGHEVAAHGYLHEKLDLLPSRVAEEAVFRRAEEAIHRVVGMGPVGFRAPYWRLSSHTMEMLAEHGRMAQGYPDVRANTVASFGLGDYEWILAFEADELYRITDLIRHLRGARARLHTRLEVPFFVGRRKPIVDILNQLP